MKAYLGRYTSNDKWEMSVGCVIVFASNEEEAKIKAINLVKEEAYWDENYEIHKIEPIESDDIFIQQPAIE